MIRMDWGLSPNRSRRKTPSYSSRRAAETKHLKYLAGSEPENERWHRERYYPVAAQIRAALPRFRHVRDVQILESSFRLADAQELVPRGKWGSTDGRRSNQEHMA